MTAVLVESDAVLAARVGAWLRVGGSWAAIAAAHGASDVEAFKGRVTPHLNASGVASVRLPSSHGRQRPAQLRLF
jgi:hypothetical protein